MKAIFLVAEIGSTTTVVTAFGSRENEPFICLAQGQAPTTVLDGDVTLGLKEAIKAVEKFAGEKLEWEEMIASSSAAGGLRMTVHGLVYDMTVRAAQEAALGAGANIHLVTAGVLSEFDVEEIERIHPNIILLAGGVDFGESETILANACQLKKLTFRVPVIYAGNCAVSREAENILMEAGFSVTIVDNVYPRIDQLQILPTRKAIQDVFETHIVEAPGMGKIRELVNGKITPTPGAVLQGAEFLREWIGDLVVVDVGGATTDIHSVTEGDPEIAAMLVAPEPISKRTVEGDLGVYVNAANVLALCNQKELAEKLNMNADELLKLKVPIPYSLEEKEFASYLTERAAQTAMLRHAGILEYLYGPSGRITISRGKDLTAVKWIIGTGGALTKLEKGRDILESLNQSQNSANLLPRNGKILLDSDYILAAAGLLADKTPDGVRTLLTKSLNLTKEITK